MDASGHLASVGWQAAILNVLLMIPLGYLVLLHFLCGDEDTASPEEGKAGEAVITGVNKAMKDEEPCVESVRRVEKNRVNITVRRSHLSGQTEPPKNYFPSERDLIP